MQLTPLTSTRAARLLVAAMRLRTGGGSGSGNWGHAGRPGEVGGSSVPAGHIVPSGILDAIRKADGGFTYHAVTGNQPTSGYALSVHPEREQIVDAADANVVALASYTSKNWDLLSASNNYLGGWHNPADGKVYLDISTVVDTPEEADSLGRAANQYAYFDLARGKSVAIASERTHVHKAAAQFDRPSKWTSHLGRPYRARACLDWTRAYTRGSRCGTRHSRTAGGVGSGNFGHAGRPGEVGGSAVGDWPIADDTVRALGNNYPKLVEKRAAPWIQNLSPVERSSLEAYTGTAYMDINATLRDKSMHAPGQVEDRETDLLTRGTINGINSALAKAPAPPPPELVWRGISFAAKLPAMHVGDVVELDGFQSTSIDPTTVAPSQKIFEIRPTHGGYIKSLSEAPLEEEFLLPHAAQYRVVGLKSVPIYLSGAARKKDVIQLEML